METLGEWKQDCRISVSGSGENCDVSPTEGVVVVAVVAHCRTRSIAQRNHVTRLIREMIDQPLSFVNFTGAGVRGYLAQKIPLIE